MKLRNDQRSVLTAMGVALLRVQATEKMIRLCMTYVLQRQPLKLESLQAQEEAERVKTMGYFLAELRKRANLDSNFDVLLKDFLRNRNEFIHDLSRLTGGGLSTPERTASVAEFIRELMHQANEVMKVFAALIRAWQEQAGFPSPPKNDWFDEVDELYKPLVDDIFLAKNT